MEENITPSKYKQINVPISIGTDDKSESAVVLHVGLIKIVVVDNYSKYSVK